MQSQQPKKQKTIIILSTVVSLLFIFAVLQQAINLTTYIDTPDHQTALLLWALMSLNVVLLTVCILILLRHLLKLYFERKSQQLGSKFRTKLVFAFLGLSFIPVIFMSFFAYFLLNRNLDKWFSTPIDQVVNNVDLIVREMNQDASNYSARIARFLANHNVVRHLLGNPAKNNTGDIDKLVSELGISLFLTFDETGRPVFMLKDNSIQEQQTPEFKKWTERLKALAWLQDDGRLAGAFSQEPLNSEDTKTPIVTALDDDGQEVSLL